MSIFNPGKILAILKSFWNDSKMVIQTRLIVKRLCLAISRLPRRVWQSICSFFATPKKVLEVLAWIFVLSLIITLLNFMLRLVLIDLIGLWVSLMLAI